MTVKQTHSLKIYASKRYEEAKNNRVR